MPALLEGSKALEVDAEEISKPAWTHGDAEGICQYRSPAEQPLVKVQNRENSAALAVTLVHEYAHALLHGDVDETERSKRELELSSLPRRATTTIGVDSRK
ncbi:hypothetical protein HALLA_03860 (plasmid) [Halostagnicola larsenii XH-48]|uniref:IrrE N-terminal-like domain-containing protein n=1 Tax=Halostagnicola larsenii XH-48 TaxID=797299 RepID=W0JSF5_9EURY|nr:hypothetical protein HALLA_03860 [Halostagnicola larsenii XH-48]